MTTLNNQQFVPDDPGRWMIVVVVVLPSSLFSSSFFTLQLINQQLFKKPDQLCIRGFFTTETQKDWVSCNEW
jgi:hypothetical protein